MVPWWRFDRNQGNLGNVAANTHLQNWHELVRKSVGLNREFNRMWIDLDWVVRYRNTQDSTFDWRCITFRSVVCFEQIKSTMSLVLGLLNTPPAI